MGGMMGGVPIADPMSNMGGMGDMTDILQLLRRYAFLNLIN